MKKKVLLTIFLTITIFANDLYINDVIFSYQLNNKIDYLYIKKGVNTTIVKQNNLWSNADVELNLLSINKDQIKLIMTYKGNRELGYIYTFNVHANQIELQQVNLYQLEENTLCKMDIKKSLENKIEIIETRKCKPLEEITITSDQLLYAAKNYKLKNILTKSEIKILFIEQHLTVKNLPIYNDIAYYLQKAGANDEAIYILETILEKYPNRTVAYLNLADAYLERKEPEKAKINYSHYIQLMREDNKENKIPKRVLEFNQ